MRTIMLHAVDAMESHNLLDWGAGSPNDSAEAHVCFWHNRPGYLDVDTRHISPRADVTCPRQSIGTDV